MSIFKTQGLKCVTFLPQVILLSTFLSALLTERHT
jgi:serine/threonine-protein kinase mTOR